MNKCHDIDIDLTGPSAEQWVVLRSDTHGDNPKSNRIHERKWLEWAREHNALIFDFGDLFDAMQGRGDPRSDKGALMEEYNASDYLDALVRERAQFLRPYADLFRFFGMGNHETSILTHRETNLTQRLVEKMRDYGSQAICGEYDGYLRLRFWFTKTSSATKLLYYTHGAGGGGPVTRGVIKTNRRAVNEPDADMVVSGHIHERWIVTVPRRRVKPTGSMFIEDQVHIQIPSMKEARSDGMSWESQREHNHKPIGVVRLVFKKYDCRKNGERHAGVSCDALYPVF